MKKLAVLVVMVILVAFAVPASAQYQFDDLYQELPFADVFPMEDGEVAIHGEVRPIKIGFVQTALNHPWRIGMNESLQAAFLLPWSESFSRPRCQAEPRPRATLTR